MYISNNEDTDMTNQANNSCACLLSLSREDSLLTQLKGQTFGSFDDFKTDSSTGGCARTGSVSIDACTIAKWWFHLSGSKTKHDKHAHSLMLALFI